MALDYDSLTPDQLRSLDNGGQLDVLCWLYCETKRLGDLKCEAIELEAQAHIAAVEDPKEIERKTFHISAKATVVKLTELISARKRQVSILQTVLRSQPQ